MRSGDCAGWSGKRRYWFAAWILVIAVAMAAPARAQTIEVSSSLAASQEESHEPELKHRPPPKLKTLLVPEGKIQLDVVVDDSAGKPLLGLEPWDFKILDNNQPRKVMSFRAFDGAAVMPDPPVEIILVIDTENLPFQEVAFVRQQVDAFLEQNGGHLKQPLSLGLLTDKGIRMQPRASTDGNALVSVVDGIKETVRTLDSAMGSEGMVERFQLSAKNLAMIAENEARKPGRKLLIWVGPGWPLLNRPEVGYSEKDQRRWFDAIVELSTRLREARIAVYSVSPASTSTEYGLMYQSFLKGVQSFRQADSGNLALKVLAAQSGGKILGPDNNLVDQIDRCIRDANAFYRISFDPPTASHADEYHDLKVVVDKAGATVRTDTGYYNQPAAN